MTAMATTASSGLDRGTQGPGRCAVVALRAALERAICTVRADNPFLPVAVVVPNHLLGARLSPSIPADTAHTAVPQVRPVRHASCGTEDQISASARRCAATLRARAEVT